MKKWTLRKCAAAAVEPRPDRAGAQSSRGRLWFAAALLLAVGGACAAEAGARVKFAGADNTLLADPPSWQLQSVAGDPASAPTTRPSSTPPRMEVIRDPLPPAVWSGGSMFALGGAFAAARSLRRRFRLRSPSDVRFGGR